MERAYEDGLAQWRGDPRCPQDDRRRRVPAVHDDFDWVLGTSGYRTARAHASWQVVAMISGVAPDADQGWGLGRHAATSAPRSGGSPPTLYVATRTEWRRSNLTHHAVRRRCSAASGEWPHPRRRLECDVGRGRADEPARARPWGLAERQLAEPSAARHARAIPGDVSVAADDMRATLRFDRGHVTVLRGAAQSPLATVRSDLAGLLDVARGHRIVASLLRGRLRAGGSPLALWHLLRF
jgi:hypothetical protein